MYENEARKSFRSIFGVFGFPHTPGRVVHSEWTVRILSMDDRAQIAQVQWTVFFVDFLKMMDDVRCTVKTGVFIIFMYERRCFRKIFFIFERNQEIFQKGSFFSVKVIQRFKRLGVKQTRKNCDIFGRFQNFWCLNKIFKIIFLNFKTTLKSRTKFVHSAFINVR